MEFMEIFKYDAGRLNELIKVNLVRFMKNICMLGSKNNQAMEEVINNSIHFMSNLYNKVFRTNLVQTTAF